MSATKQDSALFDAAKAEVFAGELLRMLNHGALCLMTSIGHRTGLFDCLRGYAPFYISRDRAESWAERAICARVAGRNGHGRGSRSGSDQHALLACRRNMLLS